MLLVFQKTSNFSVEGQGTGFCGCSNTKASCHCNALAQALTAELRPSIIDARSTSVPLKLDTFELISQQVGCQLFIHPAGCRMSISKLPHTSRSLSSTTCDISGYFGYSVNSRTLNKLLCFSLLLFASCCLIHPFNYPCQFLLASHKSCLASPRPAWRVRREVGGSG